jgi:hypothetical protein
MRLLRSINQKVIKSAEHGSGSEQDSSRRFTFGIYFYSETPVDRSTGVDEEREE